MKNHRPPPNGCLIDLIAAPLIILLVLLLLATT